ncbi:MAG: glycosyltransferase family 4 protein [Anaerolineales bacterium]|nr:glycosyltransferase family 4 protein [Anaerolineales bacterium]
MRPLSILLLGTQMAIGGAQRGLLDQARWFKSHGCKVTAAFFYDKEGLHEKWRRAVDFPIHNLEAYENGAGFLRQAGQLLMGLWRLWKLLLRERFEVVEAFTHDSNLLGLPLAWLERVPVRIATHRGRIEGFLLWRQRLHSWLVNVGIASTLVVVSEQTRQLAMDEGVRSDRIVVIPNGVMPLDTSSVNGMDARKELGLAEDNLFLLSIGRLTHQKGHEHLIQAMPKVIRRFPTAKAWICGDGPLRAQLESQIVELGLSDHVRLLGSRDDVSLLLATADIFVLPSRSEGLSRALMEAMAAGIPVVATNVGGIRDLITDGVHGLLVPSEDSERLAQSILQLLDAPLMMKRMGAAAQAHVLEAHSTDIMCQRYYDLILGLLENK